MKNKSNKPQKYQIEIGYTHENVQCNLFDIVEAKSLVEAYDNANAIVKELNEKLDRENVFFVRTVARDR